MPVSANTLFHFTSQDKLKKILSSFKFLASYSEEHFENIVPKDLSNHHILLIPLISFCDLTIIQLARDSKHTKYYDKYGIGLKKKWGNENSISPVTYVHEKSPPANKIFTLYKLTDKPDKSGPQTLLDDILLIKRNMTDSFKYLKPYDGHWLKNKKYRNAITYYNEREWRYCPAMDDFEVLFKDDLQASSIKQYERKLKIRNKSMSKFSFVKFTADDIKYIILDREREVEDFAKWMQKSIPPEVHSVLISKLISLEKIENDF